MTRRPSESSDGTGARRPRLTISDWELRRHTCSRGSGARPVALISDASTDAAMVVALVEDFAGSPNPGVGAIWR